MLFPYVYAAPSEATKAAQGFLDILNRQILYPLIILLSGVALLVFLWGGFQFIVNAHNPTERAKGRSHMIFGVIGLLVMVSAATILAIAANTFGLSSDTGTIRSTSERHAPAAHFYDI